MTRHHVRRVDQLDANLLDEELLALLNARYSQAFTYASNTFLAKFGPELDIAFKFFYKYLPLHFLGGSYGHKIFQLQYVDCSTDNPANINKLRLLAAVSVCFPWFWNSLIRKVLLSKLRYEYSHKLFDVSYTLEAKFYGLYKILRLINFCIFLQKGVFTSVIERFLGIRPVYNAPQYIRQMEYTGIGRELLWHGLSEFLGFTLPLINLHRIKGFLKRAWFQLSSKDPCRKCLPQKNECLICGNVPNFPHTIGCTHVFCYYCIASLLLADPVYSCFDCDIIANGLDDIKPLALNKI